MGAGCFLLSSGEIVTPLHACVSSMIAIRAFHRPLMSDRVVVPLSWVFSSSNDWDSSMPGA